MRDRLFRVCAGAGATWAAVVIGAGAFLLPSILVFAGLVFLMIGTLGMYWSVRLWRHRPRYGARVAVYSLLLLTYLVVVFTMVDHPRPPSTDEWLLYSSLAGAAVLAVASGIVAMLLGRTGTAREAAPTHR